MTAPSVAGWFGKIPGLGDFATRRLPGEFVHEWDDWLQHGLAAAYESFVDLELSAHGAPPIRRFWLGRGVLGPACWAGLLMPSVDRVGRRFPLTVAAIAPPVDSQPVSLGAALQARAWFAAADALMRAALDGELDVDAFDEALAGLGVGLDVPAPESPWLLKACEMLQAFAPAARGGAEFRRRAVRAEPADDGDAVVDVTAALDALPCSVWWRDGATEVHEFLCYGALPPASELGPLLMGHDGGQLAP
jgi:type VI secretion system protein ImpM